MKTIVLSGFLGAGKTTFLKYFARELKNVCILENDYANANIDTQLLKDTEKEIFSLEQGCICCSKKSDFATSVLTISNTINPDFLLVEPTGLGYLSKVVDNIKKIEYEKIEILDPITVVDYHTFEKTLKEYEELFVNQIKSAGHIIFSKIEHINKEDVIKKANILKQYTKAKIYTQHYSTFTDKQWMELLEKQNIDALLNSDTPDLNMENLVYKNIIFEDFQTLGTTLQAISENRFGKVIRGKGICRVADYYAKIDIVQGSFDIQPIEKIDEPKLVFIGQNLEKKAFDILLHQ